VGLLPTISQQERIWLHWGMAALAYPFFRDTAEVVGRLLALQDDFTTPQVQGRMLATWGDRATSREAAQKLLTTLVDWEVLRSTKTKGHFLLARKITASAAGLQLWLLEALLAASAADEIEARQLLRLPESFPFKMSVGVSDLRRYERFNIHRQGLDMDMVTLRKARPTPPKPAKKDKSTDHRAPTGQVNERVVSNPNSKPRTTPPATPSPTPQQSPSPVVERRLIEDSIRDEVLRTLSHRTDRLLQIRDWTPFPDGPFAASSAECAEQFRDGHYFGCIALAQALLEGVIRHVWQVKFKKMRQEGNFEKNLEALNKKSFISDDWKAKLSQMWANRHLFHQLCPSVESDRQKLEAMAKNTLKLLNDLEREFFGFPLPDGLGGSRLR
jgi:hypothetical protein